MVRQGDIVLYKMTEHDVEIWNTDNSKYIEDNGRFMAAAVGEEYPAVVQKIWDNGIMCLKVWPLGNGAISTGSKLEEENVTWRHKI